ncbi:dTMP kinase [Chenggangzhangella methanolivorans]|uniref:Thymidylate kinase n=1 Tax=Chenggangzhangella methanolivorans TaxID=1437009 RepID=A0A9E6R966_9HYPH|nr:dTMP kinase [Chenggangzhangella methanolivorans]QZO00100.1 dTMP kinase [Chenggangzhangella methanolivorans]
MPGRFVTFEGGEGVGKSTQIRLLAARLRALGREVVVTREPGGSPRAEALRETLLGGGAKRFGPLAETILVASARADHVDRVIRPAIARGDDVLCDRFIDSTAAYQGALGGVPPETIRALADVAAHGCRPDITLVLDASPASGLARARKRAGEGATADRFEAENLTFHERLRDAFRAIAKSEPERCALIDAEGSEDQVAERVWEAVSRRLGLAVAMPAAGAAE